MKGLNSSNAICFGRPHWCSFSSGPVTITERPEKSTRLPSRFWRNRPCLPLSMSDRDFSGRLLPVVMTRPRRPLSNSASTASCNMRFSLRTIISGACKSSRRLRRLLRLITRRYKSLRSEEANRPPSSGTKGRRSGGSSGNIVITIHSGRLPESIKLSITCNRLTHFLIFISEVAVCRSSRSFSASASRSICESRW